MNVLFGLLRAEEGEILINGQPVRFANSGEAVRHGIGMVHQHFMLVPVFTAAENVVLGFEPTKSFNRLDHKTANAKIRRTLQEVRSRSRPRRRGREPPRRAPTACRDPQGAQSRCRTLILDEPTAVLTPQEIDALMEIMRSLARDGKSILFITHKLKEVRAVADVITVIRQGRVIDSVPPTETENQLAALMVGREVNLTVHKENTDTGRRRA